MATQRMAAQDRFIAERQAALIEKIRSAGVEVEVIELLRLREDPGGVWSKECHDYFESLKKRHAVQRAATLTAED